jgi:hypothetical protein
MSSLFRDDALPAWLTEEVRQAHWSGGGPHSAREVNGFGTHEWDASIPITYPQQAGRDRFDGEGPHDV